MANHGFRNAMRFRTRIPTVILLAYIYFRGIWHHCGVVSNCQTV